MRGVEPLDVSLCSMELQLTSDSARVRDFPVQLRTVTVSGWGLFELMSWLTEFSIV
jgi:hypothetical protein